MRKVCRQCEVEHRVMDFYRASSGGVMARCKACHRANVKANRERNADYYREFDKARDNLPRRVAARKAYAQTPEGRAAGNRAKRAYLERNPIKRAAHIATGNAIRDGRLVRQPCEVCGDKQAQAHHDDYSKPLDVRWLCTTHHAEWHRNNTPKGPPQDQEEAA